MMKTARRYLLGAAIAVIACTTAARASEDDKLYAGAACQPSTATDQISRTSNGGMFNAGGLTQFWTCPVIRDNNANGSIEFARITVVDNNVSSNISCTLFSRTSTGVLHDSLPGAQSTSPTGTKSITFGLGDVNAVDVVASGYAYFRCSVPGAVGSRSGILTYTVTENVGEN
jgi:hypothetical protein